MENKASENPARPGFDRRMTKEEINALPLRRYDGSVKVVRQKADLNEALDCLFEERVVGFDTETRPSFAKGERYSTSLVQLAASSCVYLLQLKFIRFPRTLRLLLASPNVIKAGVALQRDVNELRELGDFEPAGFVDLSAAAKRNGIKNHGLRGLVSVMLGFRISKNEQQSNWAREDLTPSQIRYAATDAWASRELYLAFEREGYLEAPPPVSASSVKQLALFPELQSV